MFEKRTKTKQKRRWACTATPPIARQRCRAKGVRRNFLNTVLQANPYVNKRNNNQIQGSTAQCRGCTLFAGAICPTTCRANCAAAFQNINDNLTSALNGSNDEDEGEAKYHDHGDLVPCADFKERVHIGPTPPVIKQSFGN